jgi:hypothetical protein
MGPLVPDGRHSSHRYCCRLRFSTCGPRIVVVNVPVRAGRAAAEGRQHCLISARCRRTNWSRACTFPCCSHSNRQEHCGGNREHNGEHVRSVKPILPSSHIQTSTATAVYKPLDRNGGPAAGADHARALRKRTWRSRNGVAARAMTLPRYGTPPSAAYDATASQAHTARSAIQRGAAMVAIGEKKRRRPISAATIEAITAPASTRHAPAATNPILPAGW